MKTTSLTLLVGLGSLTAACAVDGTPSADDTETASQASALTFENHVASVFGGGGNVGGVGGVGDLPLDPTPEPPPAPTGPAVQGTLVRISSDDVDTLLGTLLSGSKIVVDTTASSPTIWDDIYHCTYPNQDIREELLAECKQKTGSWRTQCLLSVNKEYPNIKECVTTGAQFHSYFDFGPTAELSGAKDVGFEGIRQIHRDSKGPGSVVVDINYVQATFGLGTSTAWFVPEPNYRAAVNISLDMTSNQPTVLCHHTLIPCPDVELTNMKMVASLSGIRPVPEDTTKLGFDKVVAHFSFDRNLNNIPDDLVTLFWDVDQFIKDKVESNVEKALGRDGSRKALNKALTELATRMAKQHNGSSGIDRFYGAWVEGTGTLVVDYQPCPSLGCGVGSPGSPITEQ